jgi:acetylornithine/succinyldiaminopimelate/putrescine aminotransferase
MNDGLLTVAAGPLVVRWLPPLNVSTDEINTALAIMRRTLDRMANGGK